MNERLVERVPKLERRRVGQLYSVLHSSHHTIQKQQLHTDEGYNIIKRETSYGGTTQMGGKG